MTSYFRDQIDPGPSRVERVVMAAEAGRRAELAFAKAGGNHEAVVAAAMDLAANLGKQGRYAEAMEVLEPYAFSPEMGYLRQRPWMRGQLLLGLAWMTWNHDGDDSIVVDLVTESWSIFSNDVDDIGIDDIGDALSSAWMLLGVVVRWRHSTLARLVAPLTGLALRSEGREVALALMVMCRLAGKMRAQQVVNIGAFAELAGTSTRLLRRLSADLLGSGNGFTAEIHALVLRGLPRVVLIDLLDALNALATSRGGAQLASFDRRTLAVVRVVLLVVLRWRNLAHRALQTAVATDDPADAALADDWLEASRLVLRALSEGTVAQRAAAKSLRPVCEDWLTARFKSHTDGPLELMRRRALLAQAAGHWDEMAHWHQKRLALARSGFNNRETLLAVVDDYYFALDDVPMTSGYRRIQHEMLKLGSDLATTLMHAKSFDAGTLWWWRINWGLTLAKQDRLDPVDLRALRVILDDAVIALPGVEPATSTMLMEFIAAARQRISRQAMGGASC